MFQIEVNSTKILFSTFFSLAEAREVAGTVIFEEEVLFLDHVPTTHLLRLVKYLAENDIVVSVRNRYKISYPRNSREAEIYEAVDRLRQICRGKAHIVDRVSYPACSKLVEPGEFAGIPAIVVNPGVAGLLGALKAIGVVYDQLDSDAVILEGPKAEQTAQNLSPVALQFMQRLSTTPQFNSSEQEGKANEEWYGLFAQVILGRQDAAKRLAKITAAH